MLHFPTRPISVDALPCENGNTVITPLPSSVALVVVNSVGGVWIEWVGVSSIVGHVEAGFTFLSSADGVSCLLDRVCAQDGDRRLVAMSQRVERAQRSLGLAYIHTHTRHINSRAELRNHAASPLLRHSEHIRAIRVSYSARSLDDPMNKLPIFQLPVSPILEISVLSSR